MRKLVFISLLLSMTSTWAVAQDDLYFTPTKKDKKEVKEYQPPVREFLPPARHPGCDRDIDEYNRHGNFRSHYNTIDSDSTDNDIIDFAAGVPSDTTAYYDEEDGEDYAYSRRMSRFDDYYWHDPFYWDMWYGSPYWYSNAYWYGSPYWYARYGWEWYDPWYYGSWYGPYWGWGGWYGFGHHHITAYRLGGGRFTGTNNHGIAGGASNKRFAQRGGVKSTSRGTYRSNSAYRNSNRYGSVNQNATSRSSYNNNSFGGSRSSFGGSRGGSYGGSRGGGFSGGHFGGRR